jgi:hypothetical protein
VKEGDNLMSQNLLQQNTICAKFTINWRFDKYKAKYNSKLNHEITKETDSSKKQKLIKTFIGSSRPSLIAQIDAVGRFGTQESYIFTQKNSSNHKKCVIFIFNSKEKIMKDVETMYDLIHGVTTINVIMYLFNIYKDGFCNVSLDIDIYGTPLELASISTLIRKNIVMYILLFGTTVWTLYSTKIKDTSMFAIDWSEAKTLFAIFLIIFFLDWYLNYYYRRKQYVLEIGRKD